MNGVALTSSGRRSSRTSASRRSVGAPGKRLRSTGRPGLIVERTVRTPFGAALPAAIWSAVLGFAVIALLVVVGWLAAPESGLSSGQVVAAGAQGWLLANFADLQLADGALGLTPLGLALIPGFALYRSGAWAARAADVRDWSDAARTVGLLTVIYGAITTTVAVFAVTSSVVPVVRTALVGASFLALVAGGLGVARASGLLRRLSLDLPAEAAVGIRAALGALAVMIAGGGVLLVATLAAHTSQVTDLWGVLHPDPAGAGLLLVLSVSLVPNAVLWAAAYCVGPGFAVGVGTGVAPTGVVVGAVPALPLFGALPGAGDAPAASLVGLALPVVAGIVTGAVVVRDRRLRGALPSRVGLLAGGAGLAAGLTLGLLSALAAGGLGGDRMADLGPSGLQVALVAGLELAAVAAATAWEWRRHSAAEHRVAVRR
jgi:Family of unknown function (DUF6350)